MIPDRILKKHYRLVLSILNIGRGPECFNKLNFQSIFKIPYDEELPEIEDSELEEKFGRTLQGENMSSRQCKQKQKIFDNQFYSPEKL